MASEALASQGIASEQPELGVGQEDKGEAGGESEAPEAAGGSETVAGGLEPTTPGVDEGSATAEGTAVGGDGADRAEEVACDNAGDEEADKAPEKATEKAKEEAPEEATENSREEAPDESTEETSKEATEDTLKTSSAAAAAATGVDGVESEEEELHVEVGDGDGAGSWGTAKAEAAEAEAVGVGDPQVEEKANQPQENRFLEGNADDVDVAVEVEDKAVEDVGAADVSDGASTSQQRDAAAEAATSTPEAPPPLVGRARGDGGGSDSDSSGSSGIMSAREAGPPAGAGKGQASPVVINKSRSELTLDLKRRNLGAELKPVLNHWLRREIRTKLLELHGKAEFYYMNVDLSENDIGPEGAAVMVDFLRKFYTKGRTRRRKSSLKVYVHALRLYRNRLGDEGAKHVARLIIEQPKPITELHLSHNGIGSLGAAVVMSAFGASRLAQYPFRLPHKPHTFCGCWLRLEWNNIESTPALLKAVKELCGVRLQEASQWQQHDWGPLRSPSWAKSADIAPHCILYIFNCQSGGKGCGKNGTKSYEVQKATESAKAATHVIAELMKEGKLLSTDDDDDEDGQQADDSREEEEDEERGPPAKARHGELVWKPKDDASAASSAPSGAVTANAAAKPARSGILPPKGENKDLDTAVQAVSSILPPGGPEDPGLLDRWHRRLVDSANPQREANVIVHMAAQLRQQGYPDPRLWGPALARRATARPPIQAPAALLPSPVLGPVGSGIARELQDAGYGLLGGGGSSASAPSRKHPPQAAPEKTGVSNAAAAAAEDRKKASANILKTLGRNLGQSDQAAGGASLAPPPQSEVALANGALRRPTSQGLSPPPARQQSSSSSAAATASAAMAAPAARGAASTSATTGVGARTLEAAASKAADPVPTSPGTTSQQLLLQLLGSAASSSGEATVAAGTLRAGGVFFTQPPGLPSGGPDESHTVVKKKGKNKIGDWLSVAGGSSSASTSEVVAPPKRSMIYQ